MMSSRGARNPRRRFSDLDELDLVILQHAHAWGIVAARPLAAILDVAYSTATRRLRFLKADGFITVLGRPFCEPVDRAFLNYYVPLLTRVRLPGILPRSRSLDLTQPSHYRIGTRLYLPGHEVMSLLAAEWLALSWPFDGHLVITPEFILRYGRGWYGGGTPPRHPDPVLTMVPDFTLNADDFVLHVETEITLKRRSHYEKLFHRLRPSNRAVLYIVESAERAKVIRALLPEWRDELTTGIVQLGDDLALGAFLEKLAR